MAESMEESISSGKSCSCSGAAGPVCLVLSLPRRGSGLESWKKVEFLQNVFKGFDEHCALTDQAVAAVGLNPVGLPGDCEDASALFQCQRRGDERSAVESRLHDERPQREP